MSFVLSTKPGPRHRFKDIEFWAEGGLICMEKQSNGDFRAITRAEAAAKAIQFNAELQYMDMYPSERDELCKCVCALAEAVKEAKRQGDPSDPEVRKDRIRSSRKVAMMVHREAQPPTPPTIFTGAGVFESDRFRRLRLM